MCYSLQCYQTIEGKFEEKSFFKYGELKQNILSLSLSSFVARLVQVNGDQLLLWGTKCLFTFAIVPSYFTLRYDLQLKDIWNYWWLQPTPISGMAASAWLVVKLAISQQYQQRRHV